MCGRIALACLILLTGNFTWPAGAAQAESNNAERGIKAAFLYKFLGYVEWPAAAMPPADAPLTIGLVNAEDMAGDLREIVAGRSVANRPLAVKVLREGESLAGVQVLFIGGPVSGRLPQLLKTAQQRSILTITEADGALLRGSVINFLASEGRVRFEISLDSAEKSGLRLSSRMLSVAQQVYTGPQ